MFLRKHEGGTGIGPYSWPEDGSVCEVPDDLGRDLLRLGGYEETGEPEPAPKAEVKAEPAKPEVQPDAPAAAKADG